MNLVLRVALTAVPLGFFTVALPVEGNGGRPRETRERRGFVGLGAPFIENRGETDPTVSFYARVFPGSLHVTAGGEIVHSLASESRGERVRRGWTLTESFVGGKPQPRRGRWPRPG